VLSVRLVDSLSKSEWNKREEGEDEEDSLHWLSLSADDVVLMRERVYTGRAAEQRVFSPRKL
jgi:hypothetical protein